MYEDQDIFTTGEAEDALGVTNKTLHLWRLLESPPVMPKRARNDKRQWVYTRAELEKMATRHSVVLGQPHLTLANVADQVAEQERRIRRLEQQVDALAHQGERRVGRPPLPVPPRLPIQSKTSHRGRPKEQPVPEGYVVLSDFAKLHGLSGGQTYQGLVGLIKGGAKALLDQRLRTEWYRRNRKKPGFRRCDGCPQKEGASHD